MALCATTALAGAVPRLCVRGARGRFGGFGPVPGVVSLSSPPPRPACSALRVAGRPVRVSLTLARWYAIPRGLCVPRARSGCPSVVPACPFRVCALALSWCPPPPPRLVVWRAHPALSRHWALVGPFHVVRAPPRVLPRYLAPSGVPWGGRSGPGSPLLGLGLWGWRQGVPGGGAFYRCVGRLGSCAPPPPTACPLGGLSGSAIHVLWARACGCGGPALSLWGLRAAGRVRGVHMLGGGLGRGGGVRRTPRLCGRGGACRAGGSLCLIPSLCLPWAGNKAGVTGVVLSMGGVAPHTTPVRAHPASLGTICAASRCAGVGPLVLRGPHVSRRLERGGRVTLRLPSRAGGVHPPCLGGWGPGPLRLAGRLGGRGGGGVAPRPPCSLSGRRPAVLHPGPLRVAGAFPSGVRVWSGLECRPGVGGG